MTLPDGFSESVIFSGLTNPTGVEFASDGRVFVAEKSGLVKVFDGLSDSTPSVFADLRTRVHDYWDRGLLGLALHPNFPTTNSVYVLYTYDAPIGGTAPRFNDGCSDPTGDGCIVSGRVSRLASDGPEQVLIEDWCQQYPSHSIGSLAFGPDGALYVSGGDGASFNWVDYGQDGNPVNPCGDPPAGVGGIMAPPLAEGGALRSQDLRTSGDPTTLDGAILRLDPVTGQGMPDNPLAGSSDLNARRIIAHGLRNPFRVTFRPGTSELWVGDVGWSDWEEINRVLDPTRVTASGPFSAAGAPCRARRTSRALSAARPTGRAADRPRWRPLLCRPRRDDPAHPVHGGGKPAADRGRHREPNQRRRRTYRRVRRLGLERSRRGRAELRLGPRRRRAARRLDRPAADMDLRDGRELRGVAEGDRPRRRYGHRLRDDRGRAAGGHDRPADGCHHVGGRRDDLVRRLGDRQYGRGDPAVGAVVVADPAPRQMPGVPRPPLQTFAGVDSGEFVAPDHEYPSSLEPVLTATDASGLRGTASVQLCRARAPSRCGPSRPG